MRTLIALLLLAIATPALAGDPPKRYEYPFLSFDRLSTHLVANEFWQTRAERSVFVACHTDESPSWQLPDTKLGVALNYNLHKWWNLEGRALHSTRTGREELGLTLLYCVPMLSGKGYR